MDNDETEGEGFVFACKKALSKYVAKITFQRGEWRQKGTHISTR